MKSQILGVHGHTLHPRLHRPWNTCIKDASLLPSFSIFFSGNHDRQVCERTDKVFGLTLVPGSLEPNNATWQELPDHVLSKAKSGHVLLTVPKSYVPFCKEV